MTVPAPPIRILIAEDSPTQREMLVMLLEEAGGFEIVGTATDGDSAFEQAIETKPDIVLMDCHMPGANGFDATRRLMERHPLPIVMTSSSLADEETRYAFDAIKLGAVAFLRKPVLFDGEGGERDAMAMISTLRLMSEVKVVRRPAMLSNVAPARASEAPAKFARIHAKAVAIAGSTGAPNVIVEILAQMGKRPSVPILIVQHMAPGFVDGFARWMTGSLGYPIGVARDGQRLAAGDILLAPDDRHLGVNREGRVVLDDGAPIEGFRPSADFLFGSMSSAFGREALGIILSGMGRDGAAGLKAMHDAGAVTAAQDEGSCVVFGMPGAAVAMGAASHVLAPREISRLLEAAALKTEG